MEMYQKFSNSGYENFSERTEKWDKFLFDC